MYMQIREKAAINREKTVFLNTRRHKSGHLQIFIKFEKKTTRLKN